MKAISEKKEFTAANGWGAMSTSLRQAFEVEKEDVGVTKEHYLGFDHSSYTFGSSDVGRVIEVITYATGVYSTCWYFGSIFAEVAK